MRLGNLGVRLSLVWLGKIRFGWVKLCKLRSNEVRLG